MKIKFNEIWAKVKGFVLANKTASIITASVLGVAVIGGSTVGIIYAVNNNDTEEVEEVSVNATELTASALEGQEINAEDLQGVTEEIQADGTTLLKDANGTVVAKKDQSGKTTLTKDGGVALSNGSVQASGNLASSVNNAQQQTQSYVASIPSSNNVGYTASVPGTPTQSYTTPSSSSAPSTPSYSAPTQSYTAPSCNHNWVQKGVSHVKEPDTVIEEKIPHTPTIYGNKCNDCSAFFTNEQGMEEAQHIFSTGHSGTHSAYTYGETTYEIITHTYPGNEYDDYSNAYYECSICGARQ